MENNECTLISAQQKGSELLCSFRNEDGTVRNMVIDYFQPYFYAPNTTMYKKEMITSLNNVRKITTKTPYDIRKFRDSYGSYTYESDLSFDRRFFLDHSELINNEIKWNVSWIDIEARMFTTDHQGNRISHTIQGLRDGDTYITAITKMDSLYKRIKVFTLTKGTDIELIKESVFGDVVTKLNRDGEMTDDEILEKKAAVRDILKGYTLDIVICSDERELMKLFLADLQEFQPDVVTGWNVGFDFVTIYNRATRLGLNYLLTMFNPLKYKAEVKIRLTDDGNEIIDYHTPGYYVVDYMDIYKKRRGKVENSYALSYITNSWKVEIPKIDHGYGTVDDLQDGDHTLFTYYNLIDVISMFLLDVKTGYMDTSILLCNISNCPFCSCTANRTLVDSYLISSLKKRGEVRISPHEKVMDDSSYAGGYVNAETGYYCAYFCDLDFTSMYPMMMISLNISPDTYVEIPDKNGNYTIAANGARFRKDKVGIVPEILEHLFKQRKADKHTAMDYKNQYDQTGDEKYNDLFNLYWNLQSAEKVMLNSFYGVMGDKKYALYMKPVAEAVTTSGQKLIKYAITELNAAGYKVIYTDTDSCYVILGPAEEGKLDLSDSSITAILKYVDGIDELYKFINAKFDILAADMNIDKGKHRFEMKSELLGRNILIMSNKMYAFNELLSEGKIADLRKCKTDEERVTYLKNSNLDPSVIIKGIVIIKSTCPRLIRKYVTAVLKKLIVGEINRETFGLLLDGLWERKIVPDAKRDPLGIAKVIRLNKIPKIENQNVRAIKRYNETHNVSISLGEKVFFLKTLGDNSEVVYKMGEKVDSQAIDFKTMYKSTYKVLKERLIDCIRCNG
ncbi:DNA polymerase elongation subunit (family B) [Methanococcus maripaludis]|uniref:DNA polymerase n=1 Tax=Methanococcus maripaludis TaxID=39152 RepID=A0A7J9NWT1_METMI|nr:DNA polymerase domain-containing protein [Methanococcus maripaludis]MBA2851761.1 DNA polymerase elongation subunit (family B) [Methanococcus maripaludis]